LTDRAYEGATAEQLNHPLVQEFLAIHDMFQNQLAAMLRYLDDLLLGKAKLSGPETTIHTQALIRAGTQYTQVLYFHHAETTSLFPALLEEGLDTAVVDRLNTDHAELSSMIDKFNDGIHRLAVVEPAVMTNDMRRLAEALGAYLAYEETHVCPQPNGVPQDHNSITPRLGATIAQLGSEGWEVCGFYTINLSDGLGHLFYFKQPMGDCSDENRKVITDA
jgi:hypothetical protein